MNKEERQPNIIVMDNYIEIRNLYVSEYILYKLNNSYNIGMHSLKIRIVNKEELFDLIIKYTKENSPNHIDIISNIENTDYFIDINRLLFLKEERMSVLFFNLLELTYRDIIKEGRIPPSIMKIYSLTPIDLDRIKNKNMPFYYTIAFIDFINVMKSNDGILQIIDTTRLNAIELFKKHTDPFSFLPKNDIAAEWIMKRMINESIWNNDDINILINNNKWKCINSCFDYWMFMCNIKYKSSDIELFLLKTRKAWSQKKFRDSVKNKSVLNTYISTESMLKLKKIANHHNKNINVIIEAMINKVDLPDELYNEFDLPIKNNN